MLALKGASSSLSYLKNEWPHEPWEHTKTLKGPSPHRLLYFDRLRHTTRRKPQHPTP